MEKVRIQDDLYTYVNQEWMEQAIIPEDRPTVGGFADLDKEGKVVLPREEYERLKLELAIEKKRADESYTQKEVEEIIASKERIKSKETAEKIIIFLDDHCDCDSAYLVEQTKNYATKQFGVEIKE